MGTSRPGTDTQPAYEPNGQGLEASYRLAFDESIRTIASLEASVERTRSRYLTLLVLMGIGMTATAVIVNGVPHPNGFGVVLLLAGCSLTVFLAALALAVYELWPREWNRGVDAATIVEKYIETEVPASIELTLALLATEHSATADLLVRRIGSMSTRFSVFLALVAVNAGLYVSAFWVALVFSG